MQAVVAITRRVLPLFLFSNLLGLPSNVRADDEEPKPVQIVSKEKLGTYQKFMKQIDIEDKDLRALMKDEDTMIFDEEVMPGVYQNSIDEKRGVFRNDSDKPPFVGKIFEGSTFRFPFGHTGGLHKSKTMRKFNFLKLPRVKGKVLPIVWWTVDTYSGTRRVVVPRYEWLFPVGTIVGEVLWHTGPDKGSYVFEIRTGTRELKSWRRASHAILPTAKGVVKAIKELRPKWKDDAKLVKLIDHLEDTKNMTEKVLDDEFGIFSASGGVDTMPEEFTSELAMEMYKKYPLEDRTGLAWKTEGKLVARTLTPNPKTEFSLRPQGDLSYAIAVNAQTCNQCHREVGRPFADLEKQALLYGEMWGNDEVFFFHPWASNVIHTSAASQGDFRSTFREEFVKAGIFQKFDSKKHSADYYHQIPREVWPYEVNTGLSFRNGFVPFQTRKESGKRNTEYPIERK